MRRRLTELRVGTRGELERAEEMEGDLLREVGDPVTTHHPHPGGGVPMLLGSSGLRDLLVGDLEGHVVTERELGSPPPRSRCRAA